MELEREIKAETLSNIWMGSNLEYKGLKEVLDTLQKDTIKREKSSGPTVDEVNNEWKRLASFMSTQRL